MIYSLGIFKILRIKNLRHHQPIIIIIIMFVLNKSEVNACSNKKSDKELPK